MKNHILFYRFVIITAFSLISAQSIAGAITSVRLSNGSYLWTPTDPAQTAAYAYSQGVAPISPGGGIAALDGKFGASQAAGVIDLLASTSYLGFSDWLNPSITVQPDGTLTGDALDLYNAGYRPPAGITGVWGSRFNVSPTFTSIPGCVGCTRVAFDFTTGRYFRTDGVSSPQFLLPVRFDNNPAPVPLPNTFVLMLSALLGSTIFSRRASNVLDMGRLQDGR